jgi:hypothetical protein
MGYCVLRRNYAAPSWTCLKPFQGSLQTHGIDLRGAHSIRAVQSKKPGALAMIPGFRRTLFSAGFQYQTGLPMRLIGDESES